MLEVYDKDQIIKILVVVVCILTLGFLYLLYKTRNLENFRTQENFTVSNEVKAAINEIYKADINAIRNLSDFANTIKQGGDSLTIPAQATRLVDLYAKWISVENDINVNRLLKVTGTLEVNGPINFLPVGSIIMYSKETLPSGWAICDGENGTPDLRGRFVLGAGRISNNDNSYQDWGIKPYDKVYNFPNGETGGEHRHTLTIDEMPSHNHQIRFGDGGYPAGGHYNSAIVTDRVHEWSSPGVMTNAGGSLPHNNIPPYYALYYIMRIV